MERKKKARVLTSFNLRTFIEGGGKLLFKPFVDEDGRHCWEMLGVYPDGEEKPVIEGRTGLPRIVRTPRGVVAYWRLYHPDDLIVPLQVLPHGEGKL